MKDLNLKLKKAYLKLLKHSCNKKWEKARKQHAKIIGLQLEIKTLEDGDGKLN